MINLKKKTLEEEREGNFNGLKRRMKGFTMTGGQFTEMFRGIEKRVVEFCGQSVGTLNRIPSNGW